MLDQLFYYVLCHSLQRYYDGDMSICVAFSSSNLFSPSYPFLHLSPSPFSLFLFPSYVCRSILPALSPSLPSDPPHSFIYVLLSGRVHQWVSTHIPFGQNPLRTKYFQFNINTDKPPSRHQYC